ncbi:helix-turn-helix domain-containing protein [Phytohabitans sp. ZYX-F-186]|uniref:Helix-turn-helix domain-containing protein n=1 Tax=Phytohabitans maris TaxID=3071409 RepID=A0ABU0ZDS8_9ACTN|nr:helix-turn-helix domain-containing protein [Phytohabitans sp. ZYX-F-186]MDQ7905108.1 helix-turn-helix domain-containing protein [Phytohabitans sp. ZYX-F-186]
MDSGTNVSATCADERLSSVLRGLRTMIGDKWSLVVIAALVEGEQRFTTILRNIDGISRRMLAKTLRDLERDGLVSRVVHAEVPPRVEYGLTALGRTLLDPIDGLIRWVDEHGHTVLATAPREGQPRTPEDRQPSVTRAMDEAYGDRQVFAENWKAMVRRRRRAVGSALSRVRWRSVGVRSCR